MKCTTCLQDKDLSLFYKRRNRPSGVTSQCKECCKIWVKNNAKNISNYKSSYNKKRYDNDILFKLNLILRARLNVAIKNNNKTGSAVNDLGCSIEELKAHLESKFQPGMTWDNHATNGWHIDHIKPLSSFDLTNPQELKKACHYTNLQPLWFKDNLIKSDLW